MKLMYDSITAADIPATAAMVAGYVDGTWQWSDADWARFPNAEKVRIATRASTNDGHALDCESGDAIPAQCPGWFDMRKAAGLAVPTIYCNRSLWSAVKFYMGSRIVDYWIATLDGTQQVPGAAAVQYAGSNLSGGHFDLTLAQDWWPQTLEEVPSMGAFAFRAGGPFDRWDDVRIVSGSLVRRWGLSISGRLTGTNDPVPNVGGIGEMNEGHPGGVMLVPGTARVNWSRPNPSTGVSDWVIYGAQGVDGNTYEFQGTINNGNMTGWHLIPGESEDIPSAKGDPGTPGSPGSPGPPGPNTDAALRAALKAAVGPL